MGDHRTSEQQGDTVDDLSKLAEGLGAAGAETGPSGGTAAALPGLASAVQSTGGIDGLLERLRQGGLQDEVDSWVSTGQNQPVDPQRLGEALGPDTVQRMSSSSGLDIAALLPMLAAFLPQIIDMLTPHGSVPDGGLDHSVGSGGLPDLGGILGGLLGGAMASGGGSSGTTATGMPDIGGMLGGTPDDDKGR
jgi:uncharacterized protein YidB (DUF937 family)